jgi:hypothetical protein
MNAYALALTLSHYRSLFGSYPEEGSIEKALTGDNPERVVLVKPGIFLDPWGNRYELKIAEENLLIVRSPGSDGIRGTRDDLLYETTIPINR